MKQIIHLLIVTASFYACNQRKTAKINPTTTAVSVVDNYTANTTILMLDERLNNVDSMVYVFYKDPLGKDSLRYTRYYTQCSTTKITDINTIKAQINLPTERLEKVRKCRSQGKVWCFFKGEIFQTLYFSDFGGECSFMFFIKNGLFYYSELLPNSKQSFAELKKLSKQVKEL